MRVERSLYAAVFGPTTGDRVRLGDTCLWLQVEKDYTVYGDECKFGGGKVLREGMGQVRALPRAVPVLRTARPPVDPKLFCPCAGGWALLFPLWTLNPELTLDPGTGPGCLALHGRGRGLLPPLRSAPGRGVMCAGCGHRRGGRPGYGAHECPDPGLLGGGEG